MHNCLFCDLSTASINHVCNGCWEDLPWQHQTCTSCAIPLTTSKNQLCQQCLKHPPYFDQTIAAFNYLFPIDIVIPQIKEQTSRYHFSWLVQALISKLIQTNFDHPQLLIPVPQSRLKHIIKGYNQTEQLSRILSKKVHIESSTSIVFKQRETVSQAKLSAKKRKRNLKNAFYVADNSLRHVAIIDDVMTTGTTANEIAKALKKSGIKRVDVWVLARTLV